MSAAELRDVSLLVVVAAEICVGWECSWEAGFRLVQGKLGGKEGGGGSGRREEVTRVWYCGEARDRIEWRGKLGAGGSIDPVLGRGNS